MSERGGSTRTGDIRDEILTDTTEQYRKGAVGGTNSMASRRPKGHTPEGAAMTEFILSLFRANGRLIAVGDQLARDFGLTAARWQVLGAITDTPRTVAQIARHFGLTRQGVLF